MRFWNKNIVTSFVWNLGFSYPSPVNLSYFWNLGSLALFFLISQILTGIFLAMHYIPNVDLAFASVEHINLDVNYGWLVRYLHSNGASMFFFVIYIHMLRGLYYNSFSYPRQALWVSGVIIYFLMIVVAFLGYVLPWGQMSFWGATVITNVLAVIPFIGNEILIWLWGGFSVGNATLNRFFSLHFVLPFILLALSLLHIMFLHEFGSSNPLGVTSKSDDVSFNPYYTIKDLYGVVVFFIFFLFYVFFNPNYLGHSDNYILANPMVTPTHIVPEWYLLPLYAILRSIPDKSLGVLAMAGAVLCLIFLPFYTRFIFKSATYRFYFKVVFWLFLLNCLVLGWIGGKNVEPPYYLIGQISTFFYFFYFLFLLPLISWLENYHYNLKSRNKWIELLKDKSLEDKAYGVFDKGTFYDATLGNLWVLYAGSVLAIKVIISRTRLYKLWRDSVYYCMWNETKWLMKVLYYGLVRGDRLFGIVLSYTLNMLKSLNKLIVGLGSKFILLLIPETRNFRLFFYRFSRKNKKKTKKIK